ncbi:MAG: hypothetical protein JWM10_2552 [Myxococcaceae bacterium]|nr:hypothetical protein [Myxococcaceae bacterium]
MRRSSLAGGRETLHRAAARHGTTVAEGMAPRLLRPPVAIFAAAIITLLPALGSAQTFYAAPPPVTASAPAPAPRALPAADAPPERPVAVFSLRLSVGDAIGDTGGVGQGTALAYGATIGARVFVPAFDDSRWLAGADVGVDRTSGFGGRQVTQFSVGLLPGFSWATWGVAWAPRLVLASPESGDAAWGMRNGARIFFGGGVVDVEFAHQFLSGPGVVTQQLSLSVGIDPGLLVHVIARSR